MGRRFGRCKHIVVACSAWLLLAPSRADALAHQFVALTYEVDPTLQACPNESQFRALLAQQLGYDPYRLGSPSGVRVRVHPTEAGIEGLVDWSTPTDKQLGERRFASRSEECQKMIATVGFVVAVQIQLMAAEQAPKLDADALGTDSVSTGDASRISAPAKLELRPVAEATLTLKHFELRQTASLDAANRTMMVGLGPSVGFALAPDPVVLGRLFVAVRFRGISLEAGAERSLPSTNTQTYGGGFKHVLTMGTLAACGWYGSVAACGLTKLGRIHVNGFGIDRPASSDGFVAQVGPRVAYSFSLGNHLLLLGRVEALYSLTAWSVELNHVAVWSTPRLGAVAGMDLATSFP